VGSRGGIACSWTIFDVGKNIAPFRAYLHIGPCSRMMATIHEVGPEEDQLASPLKLGLAKKAPHHTTDLEDW
jgi:hypothetical protein